jgi:predicted  nucleic acid-binding Zn-ribbon protein
MPKKLTIEDAQNLAKSKNGQCLSVIYITARTKMEWKCFECGYVWSAPYYSIKSGRWCPDCGGTRKFTQKEVNDTIEAKGGTCLSEYKHIHKPLKIKCFYGHEFQRCYNDIKYGQWCSICSSSLYERICREYFEQIFGKPFPSIRPEWLMGDKGRKLELDGYCKELGIGFEHNGRQHYVKLSQINNDAFERLKYNDVYKIQLAKNMGAKIIIIPELFSMTKLSDLKQLIKNQCMELKINLPNNFDDIVIDISKAYYGKISFDSNGILVPTNRKYTIEDARMIAKNNGGECLSEYYNWKSMKFKCQNNHIWDAYPPGVIKDGSWCQQCYFAKIGKYDRNRNNVT